MGLPILTIIGKTFPARVCASLLSTIGLSELICEDIHQYEEKALFLANNPKELVKIKQKLIHQKDTTDLFNSKKFARNLETQLQLMWKTHVLETGIST
jgi:protein O-GlcNAc transferase